MTTSGILAILLIALAAVTHEIMRHPPRPELEPHVVIVHMPHMPHVHLPARTWGPWR